jgi:hypothetical protein
MQKMQKIMMAMALVLMSSVSALGDATKADWERMGQPVVDAFGQCAKSEVDRMVASSMTAEAIADAAVEACGPKLAPLHAVLMAEPFNESSAGADAGVAMMKDEVRAAALADVNERRKE